MMRLQVFLYIVPSTLFLDCKMGMLDVCVCFVAAKKNVQKARTICSK